MIATLRLFNGYYLDFCSGVFSIQTPINMFGLYLPVVLINFALQAIQDDALIKVRSSAGVINFNSSLNITL